MSLAACFISQQLKKNSLLIGWPGDRISADCGVHTDDCEKGNIYRYAPLQRIYPKINDISTIYSIRYETK